MQALSGAQYERLSRLAAAYQQHHADDFKADARRNPHLGVDALCFQPYGDALIGVLITPLALLLARIALVDEKHAAASGDRHVVELPSGRYLLSAESLDTEVVWLCELLDDLSALSGPMEASKLAQQVMDRIMTPADDNAR
ncbi:MAG TPA: [NiFe]-hydrogenase assembly chaperone HybE [Modicisalibacter sp.]|nr:[NiFe]-hydrogenase assembly chaperone HybE [Modicisalibacter sp.]